MKPFESLDVYAGPNGAGKSTLRDIGDDPVGVVIDPDRIAREIGPGAPESVQVEAGRAAIMLFQRCIAQGKSMSLESTLTGNTVLRRMRDVREAGFEVLLRYVALQSAKLHIDRVRQRVRKGGHDIPPDTIIRRYENSLENLPKALEIAGNATVMDNSAREKRFLLRAERGVILELDPTRRAGFSHDGPKSSVPSPRIPVARESAVFRIAVQAFGLHCGVLEGKQNYATASAKTGCARQAGGDHRRFASHSPHRCGHRRRNFIKTLRNRRADRL